MDRRTFPWEMPDDEPPAALPAPSVVERVLYVDAGGKVHQARTLEQARTDQRIRLLLKLGRAITVVHAKYSASGDGGTWHHLPKPD